MNNRMMMTTDVPFIYFVPKLNLKKIIICVFSQATQMIHTIYMHTTQLESKNGLHTLCLMTPGGEDESGKILYP